VEAKSPHTLEEARRLLASCVFFRDFTQEERDALVARCRVGRYANNETIFLMGDPGDCMMAVLEGAIRISVTSPAGKQIVLTIMQPGDFFGEIALLDGKERTADATAMGATVVAILYRRDVINFLDKHPKGWPKLVDVLCERLRRTTLQVSEVALLELPVRLAKAVLRFTSAERNPESGEVADQIQLSQRELGYIVGATRESINKCLREWQRAGMVKTDGTMIRILKRGDLELLADSDDAHL
jgi:CRP/FNR family cyclic AMP-dependent transcriptional regulator